MTGAFDWQGKVGEAWAEEWRRTDRALAPLQFRLTESVAAATRPEAIILDIGCGAGATALALARRLPHARILGLDLSEDLIAVAKARAGETANLDFAVGDAGRFNRPDFKPDILVSRHGVMFFDDPVAAFASLCAASSQDARLVFSCFRSVAENGWASEIARALPESGTSRSGDGVLGPGPFAFADPAIVADILTRAGWIASAPTRFDFAYLSGEGEDAVAEAFAFFSRIGPAARAIRELGPEASAAFRARLEALLRERLDNGRISFDAAAWIWEARAGESEA